MREHVVQALHAEPERAEQRRRERRARVVAAPPVPDVPVTVHVWKVNRTYLSTMFLYNN